MQAAVGGKSSRAQTRAGHAIERVDNVTGKAVRLDIQVPIQHISSVLFDLEMRESISVASRIIGDRDVGRLFNEKGLAPDQEALNLWLLDVANNDFSPGNAVEGLLKGLRTGLSVSKMAFSYTTILAQPLGIVSSGSVVGYGRMASTYLRYVSRPFKINETAQFALARSATMRTRGETFERDYQWLLNQLDTQVVRSRFNRAQRFLIVAGFYGIAKLQFWSVDVPTWMAGYNKAIDQGKSEAEAAAFADMWLSRAQGAGDLASRSAIERGTVGRGKQNIEMYRLLTVFGSYMISGRMNRAIQLVGEMKERPSLATIVQNSANLMAIYSIDAIFMLWLKGELWDEDTDEEDRLKIAAQAVGIEMLMGGASGVPGIRDLASAMRGYGGGGGYGSIVADLSKGYSGAMTFAEAALEGETDKNLKSAAKGLVTSTSYFTKLPAVQINRVLDALYEDDRSVRGDIEPYSFLIGRRD